MADARRLRRLPHPGVLPGRGANAGLTVHLDLIRGDNPHHIVEAAFKAFARALDGATAIDPRVVGVPSTKGAL